ncbi:MAG: hypothetical protein ACI84C_000029 [Flavobacteriales bacterium]|jgi:hypothetical protein
MTFQFHPQIQLPEDASHLTRNAYFCWDMSTGEHKSMKAIAGRLQHALQDLEDGALDLGRVDELCEEARELYERLVVLRFKAMEEEVSVVLTKTEPVAENASIEDKLIPPNQTSLIDAIAAASVPVQEKLFDVQIDVAGISDAEPEVVSETQEDQETISEEVGADEDLQKPAPSEFGFSISAIGRETNEIGEEEIEEEDEVVEEEIEETVEEEITDVLPDEDLQKPAPSEFGLSLSAVGRETNEIGEAAEEEVEEVIETEETNQVEVITEEVVETVGSVDIGLAPEPATINDRHSNGRRELSLAEKLEMTAIPDLKKAISLNQKFLFINELFDTKDTSYHEAISEINSFGSYNEAWNYLELNCGAANWNMEDEVVEQFVELVERRFIA